MVLYITSASLDAKSGGGVNGRMHYMFVNDLFDHVQSIFICEGMNQSSNIYCGKSTFIDKIFAVLRGYPPYLHLSARKIVLDTIVKEKVSLVYIDNSVSGKLLLDIKKKNPDVMTVAFFHDIEGIKMKEDKGHSIFRRIALKTYFANEALTAQVADKTIVLNSRDALLYKKLYQKSPDAVVPICVPFQDIAGVSREEHRPGEILKLLFVGVDYLPNVTGVRWFINEVSRRIRCRYRLLVVGYHMEKYKEEFENANNNISVLGTVEDLTKYYRDADVIIGPISEGGGMKVKTAEAFSYGKHFIGRSESLIGYWEELPENLKGNKVYCADSPSQYAEFIDILAERRFFKNDEEIYSWAKELFSYEQNLKKYEKILQRAKILKCGLE